jgi:hypothetical protein
MQGYSATGGMGRIIHTIDEGVEIDLDASGEVRCTLLQTSFQIVAAFLPLQ